jgi:hypothetical protein
MEYTITGYRNGFEENENEVVEVTGLADGDYSVSIQLPYNYALRNDVRFDGTLLVAVAKSGFIGWLQRKIISR